MSFGADRAEQVDHLLRADAPPLFVQVKPGIEEIFARIHEITRRSEYGNTHAVREFLLKRVYSCDIDVVRGRDIRREKEIGSGVLRLRFVRDSVQVVERTLV